MQTVKGVKVRCIKLLKIRYTNLQGTRMLNRRFFIYHSFFFGKKSYIFAARLKML